MAVKKRQATPSFVGRSDELAFFRDNCLNRAEPDYIFFSVSVVSGIGKSTLLDHFQTEAKNGYFKDYVRLVRLNNPDGRATPESLMFDLAGQFKKSGHRMTTGAYTTRWDELLIARC